MCLSVCCAICKDYQAEKSHNAESRFICDLFVLESGISGPDTNENQRIPVESFAFAF